MNIVISKKSSEAAFLNEGVWHFNGNDKEMSVLNLFLHNYIIIYVERKFHSTANQLFFRTLPFDTSREAFDEWRKSDETNCVIRFQIISVNEVAVHLLELCESGHKGAVNLFTSFSVLFQSRSLKHQLPREKARGGSFRIRKEAEINF